MRVLTCTEEYRASMMLRIQTYEFNSQQWLNWLAKVRLAIRGLRAAPLSKASLNRILDVFGPCPEELRPESSWWSAAPWPLALQPARRNMSGSKPQLDHTSCFHYIPIS